MSITGLVNKLKMAGFEILESNSFSVIYRKQGSNDCELIRDVQGVKHVQELDICKVKNYSLTKYFVAVYNSEDAGAKLYIKDSEFNLLASNTPTYICYADHVNDSVIGIRMPYDNKVLLCESREELYLINYLGKKIDLTRYKMYDDGTLGGNYIAYDKESDTYSLGFYYTLTKQGIESGILLQVDPEFENIRFLQ